MAMVVMAMVRTNDSAQKKNFLLTECQQIHVNKDGVVNKIVIDVKTQ
jgi:hypothetical protein